MKKLIAVLISLMLLCGAALPALAEDAAINKKDETVYILAAADGTANRVIVSDYLSNPASAAELADVSSLSNIENVKGAQTFENGVWQAEGEDIYYQGEGETPLPVELNISYSLNGEPIAPDELAGRDGHVAIRFDFIVNQTGEVFASLDADKLVTSQSLKDAVSKLSDGMAQLLDGARAMLDGLEMFSDEAVDKLDRLVSEDLEQLLERVRELIRTAQASRNYSGIADGVDASVRYIWRTDAIGG